MKSFWAATGIALIMTVGQLSAEEGTNMATNQTASTTVIMETSEGSIEIELFADKAPISVSNFLAYADAGFYGDTIFHRVIPRFMIQGGGFDESMRQKPNQAPIKNEAANGLKNERGTLAMARTSVIDSATSQFFINVANNDFLNHGGRDYGYAVFGKVTAGMDVVDKIAGVQTGVKNGMGDVPVKSVLIKSVKRK
jgi:peptidyl-prolyl cis-trans isomerase A (cyclophilin A)